ncbi:MAG: GAF and ANTAR domain-containing protein [Aeromicrobium sp.]
MPQTVEALRELTRLGDETIARTLLRMSREAARVVPETVGISLSLIDHDLTFTMTATTGSVAKLDGMQYLAGGPCDETLRTGEPHTYRADEPDDEERWQLFARATAAEGVQATLSLPILDGERVVAGINIYASTSDAFDGKREELAEACGAWAGGAVTNADLGFTTRFRAAEAPDRLREDHLLNQVMGVLMAEQGLSAEEAKQKLQSAAQRAGIADAQMAQAILDLLTDRAQRRDPPGDSDQ